MAWAYDTIVDSITVSGNRQTRTHVILREMETRPGQRLDEPTLVRDIRFLNGMSPFASVEVTAVELRPGHCALRIHVIERSELFVKAILPYLKYDFESGLTYGIRWNDKNFRGRIEQLAFTFTRNERRDENFSFGWTSPWIGWRHISVGARGNYFNRGDEPDEVSVLERTGLSGFVGFPLTESRIKFSQLQFVAALNKSRTGARYEETTKEISLSPLVGYRFDSRDSHVRPGQGIVFVTALRATYPLDDGHDVYYWLWNELRHFRSVGEKHVIGLLSDFQYQFGDFPDYSVLKLGGPRSLRGRQNGRFSGFHRWFGTVEWRYEVMPKKILRLPIVRTFDISLGLVTFIDGGIVWDDTDSFELENLRGTGGLGLRVYSPLRDVLRFDFGFNLRGSYRFHFGTGVRF
ncbi:MAG: BamA/TamA family outer membrane protein [Candidatus Latescibacterota bacterium]|nr:MAG: BamA/TamA family outer membrane protein [Candidatus Latescibacterota bacterium]